MKHRNPPGPPALGIRPPPEGKIADISCQGVERLLDSLAEGCGIGDAWKVRKQALDEEDAPGATKTTNTEEVKPPQRTDPMSPRLPPVRNSFGSSVFLDSQLRKRLAIKAAFRVAALGIAVLAFILCAASSYESGGSIVHCLTRAAFAGFAAFIVVTLVGMVTAEQYWKRR